MRDRTGLSAASITSANRKPWGELFNPGGSRWRGFKASGSAEMCCEAAPLHECEPGHWRWKRVICSGSRMSEEGHKKYISRGLFPVRLVLRYYWGQTIHERWSVARKTFWHDAKVTFQKGKSCIYLHRYVCFIYIFINVQWEITQLGGWTLHSAVISHPFMFFVFYTFSKRTCKKKTDFFFS